MTGETNDANAEKRANVRRLVRLVDVFVDVKKPTRGGEAQMGKEEYIELECGGCGYRKRVLKSKYDLLQRTFWPYCGGCAEALSGPAPFIHSKFAFDFRRSPRRTAHQAAPLANRARPL